jgi:hypothetical protein
MFIWYYVELILMVLLPLIVVTQMLYPAVMNKPVFPFFRAIFRKKRLTEEEIRELQVAKEVKELEAQAKNLKKENKRGM